MPWRGTNVRYATYPFRLRTRDCIHVHSEDEIGGSRRSATNIMSNAIPSQRTYSQYQHQASSWGAFLFFFVMAARFLREIERSVELMVVKSHERGRLEDVASQLHLREGPWERKWQHDALTNYVSPRSIVFLRPRARPTSSQWSESINNINGNAQNPTDLHASVMSLHLLVEKAARHNPKPGQKRCNPKYAMCELKEPDNCKLNFASLVSLCALTNILLAFSLL